MKFFIMAFEKGLIIILAGIGMSASTRKEGHMNFIVLPF